MIDSYSFGKIKICGKNYYKDITVFEKEIKPWKRAVSHKVLPEDILEVIGFRPERVIFGTGMWGKMKVDKATITKLENSDIKINISKTPEAVRQYNKYQGLEKAYGLFHLTC